MTTDSRIWRGTSISTGHAVGPVRVARRPARGSGPTPPDVEWAQFEAALSLCRRRLRRVADEVGQTVGEAQAQVFDFPLGLLADPQLKTDIRSVFNNGSCSILQAVDRVLTRREEAYLTSEDPALRLCASAVTDVQKRLTEAIVLGPDQLLSWAGAPEPHVLVAEEILPTEVALLERDTLLAIVTERGGPNSHAAILARALGIPAVSRVHGLVHKLVDGDTVLVDGTHGRVILHPRPEELARLEGALRDPGGEGARHEPGLRPIEAPTRTIDGTIVRIFANVASFEDLAKVSRVGAEGIGLVRTEMFFQNHTTVPDVEVQTTVYRRILQEAGPMDVVFRLMDGGGDKLLRFAQDEPGPNAALGVRGVRWLLRHADVLQAQLHALCRLRDEGEVRILIPMVAHLEEVEQVQDRLLAAARECAVEAPELGAMIEVPAACFMVSELATICTFFSLGTNDLMQYLLASDRLLEEHALHPALIRLIRVVAQECVLVGVPFSACGELAADAAAVPLFVGLGVEHLSVAPDRVQTVRQQVAGLTVVETATLVESVGLCRSTDEVGARLRTFLSAHGNPPGFAPGNPPGFQSIRGF